TSMQRSSLREAGHIRLHSGLDMARLTRTASTKPSTRGSAGGSGSALIDWREPERNTHVLDWRERAHEFGLVPVNDGDEAEIVDVQPPERLLHEEEEEAFEDQHIEDDERDDYRDESEEPADADLSRDDLAIVRTYLP